MVGAKVHSWPVTRISIAVAGICALLQPLSGDVSARAVARLQPAKLAAMEALFETRTGAPLTVGGWPDMDAQEVRFGIEIPKALSFLAHHDFNAEVAGLDQVVPRENWRVLSGRASAFRRLP